MGLWIGNKIPRQLAIGSTEAKAVYKGAVKQWERKEEEFLRRVSPATADVVLGTIKGKSLVWNQLVDTSTTSVYTISGRKYYTLIGGTASIVTGDGTPMSVTGGVDMVTDLTLLFGAGNEPSTVEEFEAMFPADYYAYDEGSLLNLTAESVVSNGQTLQLGLTDLPVISPNIWDEEWEVGGIDPNSGDNIVVGNMIRSTNYNHCTPGTKLKFTCPSGMSNWLIFYDSDKVLCGKKGFPATSLTDVPDDAVFFRFSMSGSYGTTYHNDICINISDASINGTYWPHNPFKDGMKRAGSAYDETTEKVATRRLGVVDLGTLNWYYNATNQFFFMTNGYIFPTGQFARRGSYLQTRYQPNNISPTQLIDKEITNSNYASDTASLIIKDSAYTSAEDFKAAMAGVLLYYELATPQEFPFSTPKDWTYKEQQGGTVHVLPANDGSTPSTAPLDAIISYNY